MATVADRAVAAVLVPGQTFLAGRRLGRHAAGAAWLLLAALSIRRWHWLAQPLGAAFDRYRPILQAATFAVLGLWWLVSLASDGASAPLPWIALLNPLDLAQLLAVLVLAALRRLSVGRSMRARAGPGCGWACCRWRRWCWSAPSPCAPCTTGAASTGTAG
ncbi:hypothetical protein [Stenotrophomonas nitritireducens]|uniref:hypothetical protein n=1 Tax=Stenotrophomonas nitritireducens TaxID=83617 RepID=UPI003D97908D